MTGPKYWSCQSVYKLSSNGLMHSYKVFMVETVSLTLLCRADRSSGALWTRARVAMTAESEYLVSADRTRSSDRIDFNQFTDLPAPPPFPPPAAPSCSVDQPLFVHVCDDEDEGRVEQLKLLRLPDSSVEESPPTSVDLKNVLSLSMVDR